MNAKWFSKYNNYRLKNQCIEQTKLLQITFIEQKGTERVKKTISKDQFSTYLQNLHKYTTFMLC